MVAFLLGGWSTALVTALAASPTKNEAKFDQMLGALSLSPTAIECIDSPRSRVLFRGVEAGCQNAEIRTAFRIVYRDLAPIRMAGDLIFGQLVAVADQAVERGDAIAETSEDESSEDANAVAVAATLATSRRLFDLLDGDNSGGLDRDELLASPALLELIRSGITEQDNDSDNNNAVVDRFMALADENGDGVISFVEFANAAATQPQLRLVDDALAAAFASSAATNTNSEPKSKKGKGLFGRKPPDERFDEMLRQCLEWEERLGCAPSVVAVLRNNEAGGLVECIVDAKIEQQQQQDSSANDDEEGRLLQVLKGALVGASCDPVVEALKMCYLDYSPLRLGGDVIFKLLGRVVQMQLPPNE